MRNAGARRDVGLRRNESNEIAALQAVETKFGHVQKMNKLELEIGDVPKLIYRQLKDRILSGELPAGAPVKIQEIADGTSASAVPVREAIRMLASEGLMELRPRRSPIVAPLELSEITQIANVRLALEPYILQLAIPKHTSHTLKTCQDLILRDKESASYNEKVGLNQQFHLALLEPADQPRAIRIISDQYQSVSRFAQMLVMHGVSEFRGHIHREHQDILEEVRSGDSDRAAQMLTEHIRSAALRVEAEMKRLA